MNSGGFIAVLPLIVVSAGTLLVMIAIAIHRSHKAASVITCLTLAAAFASLWIAAPLAPRRVTPLLIVDTYALLYMGVVLGATLAVTLLSYSYLERADVRAEECYILLLTSAAGGLVLAMSTHFAALFLGVELLSIPLYALMAYVTHREKCVEAGLKYLVLAGASSAFMLFGIALIYAERGSLAFADSARGAGPYTLAIPGVALVLVGLAFKLGVVPFHLWTPDVYQGAPAPITAFVATVSKGAAVAATMRFLYLSGALGTRAIPLLVTIVAVASMLGGNLLALRQNSLKRLLAYSSISHLGYILGAIEVGGALAVPAVGFYVVAYAATLLVAFGVVAVLSPGDTEADDLSEYRGLFWSRPWLGSALAIALLSLTGLPLTAGFIAKYYVLAVSASDSAWVLAFSLIIGSGIGIYYYLRVLVAVYSPAGGALSYPPASRTGLAGIAVLGALVIFLGVYPVPLLRVLASMAP